MRQFTNMIKISVGLAVAAFTVGACGGPPPSPPGEGPTTPPSAGPTAGRPPVHVVVPCGTYSGTGCAPDSRRVDLAPPTFTNPTAVTNPLFPITNLRSAVLLGSVDGLPFRAETTLLPQTGTVTWNGTTIEVLLSQYTAYLDGAITEVAIDRYAQDDQGSVWYLGEDVFDYERGGIVVSEGTWLAGRDGPPAMIMPAHPRVGDVFRVENVPGVVFEEVTVTKVDQTVNGPLGPLRGVMVGSELHLDGSRSDKVFAPGYGEFRTADGADVEALAVAVDVARSTQAEPAALARMGTAAWGLVESARLEDWTAARATYRRLEQDRQTAARAEVPLLLRTAMDRALIRLGGAVGARKVGGTVQASIDVAQAVLDLQLRYRSVTAIDVERFHLHTQQLRVAASANRADGVAAEVATLDWLRDRITGSMSPEALAGLDRRLGQLRTAADARHLASAADHAARLGAYVRTAVGQ